MKSLGIRVLTTLLAAIALSAGAGCTNPPGKVPVSIPVYNFEAPERSDVFPDEEEQEDTEPADEVEESAAPAPKPAVAHAAAAKPAATAPATPAKPATAVAAPAKPGQK